MTAMPAPVAAYNFNAGTGLTAADSSINGHTMTLNSTTWSGSGHTGSAITGTASGEGAKASFTAPATAITVMAWVKPLDLTAGSTRPVVGFIDNGGSTGCAIWAQRGDFGTSNVLQANIRLGTLRELDGPAMSLNIWSHVAITHNGSTAILYKDGVPVSSVNVTSTIGQGDQLYVAGWAPSDGYIAQAIVDDVRVYKTALTRSQIVTAMNTPVA